jgi:uncharacterized membrane protein
MQETLGETSSLIEPLTPALATVASVIDLIGIAIVLWGFLRALVGFLRNEAVRFRSGAGASCMQQVRIDLGTYILVGIEFMIASDIIHTVVTRRLVDLAFVSALVAIRTAISFFLSREIAEAREEEAG